MRSGPATSSKKMMTWKMRPVTILMRTKAREEKRKEKREKEEGHVNRVSKFF
jgi:hypothetical protein